MSRKVLCRTYIWGSDRFGRFFDPAPQAINRWERFALWFLRKFTDLSVIRYLDAQEVGVDFAAAENDFQELLTDRGTTRSEDIHVLQVAVDEDTGEIV